MASPPPSPAPGSRCSSSIRRSRAARGAARGRRPVAGPARSRWATSSRPSRPSSPPPRDPPRHRRLLGHRGARAGAARARHRPRRRGHRPGELVIATAEAVSLAGATPRLVDVDPETHLLTAGSKRPRRPAHALRDPCPPDGLDRRHGALWTSPAPRACHVIEDCAQAHGARGRRPARRHVRRPRLLLVLPDQEPRRLGRRRRRDHRRPGARGSRPAAALARRGPALPPQRGRHDRAAGRPAGGAAAGQAPAAGGLEQRPPPRRRRAARGPGGHEPGAPGAGVAGGDHVYHLFIARTQQRETCARSSGARCLQAVHAPSRSTGPGPTRTGPGARAACQRPSGSPSTRERCRSPPT